MSLDETRAPLTAHLAELRTRLMRCSLYIIVGFILAYIVKERLFAVLAQPLLRAWSATLPKEVVPTLHFADAIEPFWVYLKLSLVVGLFMASPFVFHELWMFIAPGLYDREKKVALPFAVASGICFIGGATFGYFFVFPRAFEFFLGFAQNQMAGMAASLGASGASVGVTSIRLQPTLMMQQYFGLMVMMLLSFGIVFETPLVLIALSGAGIVSPRTLWRFNRYAIVLIFIVAAILTPDPTVFSQIMMAVPMCILYNLGVLISWLLWRKRQQTVTEEASAGTEAAGAS
jgi:sec-independent protein translocase protein TatC